MYKEEGNEWTKKKGAKDMRAAFDCYAQGIAHAERGLAEAAAGAGAQADEGDTEGLYAALSALYSNRALCSLALKNFRAAHVDSIKSLQYNAGNVKAHFRKCKALLGSRRFEECERACEEALRVDPDSAELGRLRAEAAAGLARRREGAARKAAERAALQGRLGAAWALAAARGASLGLPRSQHPAQFADNIYPSSHPAEAEAEASTGAGAGAGAEAGETDLWPLLCLYPQHNQIDVLHAVSPDELLVVVLSQMFSEPGEGGGAPWDRAGEYFLSRLVVYIPIGQNQACSSQALWADRMCTCILDDSKDKDKDSKSKSKDKADSKEIATGIGTEAVGAGAGAGANTGPDGWAEAHMGCTLAQLLAHPRHTLDGALLTLTVFVRCVCVCCTVLYCAVLCCVVLCCAVLCCTVLLLY
jgi:hypothetical protein